MWGFTKVESHQRPEDAGGDAGLRHLIVGTDAADTAAKAAVQCADPIGRIDFEVQWRSATAVLRHTAKALSLFPYAKEQYAAVLDAGRAKRHGAARRGHMQRGASHQFTWTGGAWQCQKCGRLAHRPTSRVAISRCSAMPGPLSRCVELANKLGHPLWAGEVGRTGLPLLVCMRCGAFAMSKPLLLMRACARRCANAAAKKVRARLLDGKHPEDGRAVGKLWRVAQPPPFFSAASEGSQAAGEVKGTTSMAAALGDGGIIKRCDPCGFEAVDHEVTDEW